MRILDYIIPSKFGRKSGLADKLLGGSLTIMSGIDNTTRAEDYYIQPGTYWRDVNEVLANTQPRDRVFLLDGEHVIAFEQEARYIVPTRKIYFGGVDGSRDSVIVKFEEDRISGEMINVTASKVVLANMTLQGPAYLGVHFIGESASQDILEKIKANNLEMVAAWDNHYAKKNSKPSFIFRDMYIQRASVGFHFNNIGRETTSQSRYASFTNITADNVRGGLIGPPFYRENDKFIANGEFFDSVVINSGSIFSDDIFWSDIKFKTTPDGFVEWNNTSQSLFSRDIGERNKEVDPLLNCYGRPEINSPVFDVRANNGHSGAFSFSGDFNNDSDEDLQDYSYFPQTFNGPNIQAPLNFKNTYDSDCDTDVDLKDFSFFQNVFTGEM